nr:integrase, catalytic region, zinc finger, CCHC-type, peptidase aspartic, catalytic [Tanacetum cinerariifolium]
MSRDVLTVGSTMRISLLYRGLPNDIYSLIDINKTAKDLWDALARHMLGSEYGEQDRKATFLYEYETFKATERELLLDAYIRYFQWKQYAIMMRHNKNLMDINIDALYNILKQNQGEVNYDMRLKKKTVVVTSDPLALIAEKTKMHKRKEKVVVSLDSEGSDADDLSELRKITTLLAKAFNQRKFYSKPTNNNLRTSSTSQSSNRKQEFVKSNDKKVKKKDDEKKQDMSKKDKDEQVFLAEDQAWMESSSDLDQEINTNMVFMAQIEKVLSDLEASSLSVDDMIFEVSYYLSESKSESEYETLEYYDNTTTYGLFVNDNYDQVIFHDCENFSENLIESQIDHNESAVDHNDSEGIYKLIRKFNKKIVKCLKRIEKANQQNKDFENQNKDLQDKYDVLKNQATTFEMKNKELNEQLKVLSEKNDDLLAQTNVLKDQLQVKHVVIDTHVELADQEVLYDKMSVQLVEMDKHVRDLKNMVLEKDFKISELEECMRNKDLEIEKCLERLNECENKIHKIGQTNQNVHMIMPSKDKMYNGRKGTSFENPSYFCKAKDLRPALYDERVINLGYTLMFLTHSDEALEIEKFKRARENKIEFAYGYRNLNTSYVNEKINFLDDYFQKIINPNFDKIDSSFQQTSLLKPYVPTVILEKIIIDLEDEVMRKGSSNTVKADLSSVNHSNLNKNVKRYSHKNLMACNNSDTCSAFDCNNARNALCNARMNASIDVNDLFVFDDIVQIYLWIIDSGYLKHMTGNHALLTQFVEKFLGTVRFGNNDFAVIAGYGDVVIGSITIKKVYYVEG